MLLETDLAPRDSPPGPERSPLATAAIAVGVVAGAMLLVYLLWLMLPS
jgi:hypothetical protein